MKTVTKLIACYVRVSTVGQNEAGQIAEIERWIEGNGIDATNVRWFIDKGKSGDNLKRPAFEKLQASVFAGEIATIVTYKLDRLSRSLIEGLTTLAGWCEKGIRVVSTSQNLDFNGTIGKMLAAIFFGLAEMEQQTRKERQRAGIEVAKKNGVYKGRKQGTLKASPERAAELRDKGLTIAEIELALGVKRNSVFRYLRQSKSIKVPSAR